MDKRPIGWRLKRKNSWAESSSFSYIEDPFLSFLIPVCVFIKAVLFVRRKQKICVEVWIRYYWELFPPKITFNREEKLVRIFFNRTHKSFNCATACKCYSLHTLYRIMLMYIFCTIRGWLVYFATVTIGSSKYCPRFQAHFSTYFWFDCPACNVSTL